MDVLFEFENEEHDKIILSKIQMEVLTHKQFKNDRHWEIFRNNFLTHFIYFGKKNIFEYYAWSEKEYQDLISRQEEKR